MATAELKSLALRSVSDAQGARVYPLLEGKYVLGRSPLVGISLNDRQVSREHAAIHVRGGEHLLVDLDSTNGCYVNDQLINKVKLHSGDRVRVGNSVFVVEELRYQAGSARAVTSATRQKIKAQVARELTLPQNFEQILPDWRERPKPSRAALNVLWGLAAALAGSLLWAI